MILVVLMTEFGRLGDDFGLYSNDFGHSGD